MASNEATMSHEHIASERTKLWTIWTKEEFGLFTVYLWLADLSYDIFSSDFFFSWNIIFIMIKLSLQSDMISSHDWIRKPFLDFTYTFISLDGINVPH